MLKIRNINSVIIHFLSWCILILINLLTFYSRSKSFPVDYQFYLRLAINILIFYFNYSLLVPKLLLNKKILIYIIVSIAFILFFSFISNQFAHSKPVFNHVMANSHEINPFQNKDPRFRPGPDIFLGVQILITILLFAVGVSIKLVNEFYKNEKIKNLIEKQKINTELSFLKNQLNPHFLFNTLNSIYALANKSNEYTKDAIVTLAELMRYMLYETNQQYVPLKKEIEYIKNYISLQILRLKDSSGLNFNVQGNLDYKIQPLLLISFIENAFKYGTDYTGKTNINIKIVVENKQLTLSVINYVSLKKNQTENSGVGMQNIKARLNLLYPNLHTLKIDEKNGLYNVELSLKLK